MQLYQTILAVAAVIIFFSGLPLSLFALGVLDFPPAVWVISFGILAFPPVISSALFRIKYVLPMVIWCFVFLIVSMVWFFIGHPSSLALEGFQYRFITVGTLLSVVFILLSTSSLFYARMSAAICLFLSVCLNIYDLLNPYTIGFLPGRASGLYLNPNTSAEALVLGMLICVTQLSPTLRIWFVHIIGIGVLTTFSRAGLLAYAVSVIGLMVCRLISPGAFFVTLCSAVLLGGLATVTQNWETLLEGWDQAGLVSSTEIIDVITERITWFTDPGTSDGAMTERLEGAQQAWQLFSDHPFLGGGTGTNFDTWAQSDEFRKPGPHNIFLWLMVDHGIIGALIFPALLMAIGWKAKRESRTFMVIVFCVLILMGFSSHNLLDGRHILFSLGVLTAMVAQADKRSWDKSGERRNVSLSDTASCASA
jgi:hypothetical protein